VETKKPTVITGKRTGKGGGRKGRIENLRPWKPGQSGNPKGGPKRSEQMAAILLDFLETIPPEDMKKRPWKQLVAEALVKASVKGNVAAIKEIFDRTDGKVPLPLHHGGSKGGSLLGDNLGWERIKKIGEAALDIAKDLKNGDDGDDSGDNS